jgi:hypothetical protein
MYCTKDDLENHLRDFDALVPKGKNPDIWAEGMISRADSYINTRLGRRFGAYIPFDTKVSTGTPEIIKTLSIEIACYYILRCNYAGQSLEKLQGVRETYWTPCQEVLNLLSKGNLEITEIATSGGDTQVKSTTEDYVTEFQLTKKDSTSTVTEGNMDDW